MMKLGCTYTVLALGMALSAGAFCTQAADNSDIALPSGAQLIC